MSKSYWKNSNVQNIVWAAHKSAVLKRLEYK